MRTPHRLGTQSRRGTESLGIFYRVASRRYFSWMPSRYIVARTRHSRFPSTTCI
jgi:hypothetical protein